MLYRPASLYLGVLAMGILMTMPVRIAAQELSGPAQAMDGGTLVIAGQRLRLQGIAAPALTERCALAGAVWRCGQDAAFALAALIERHWLDCVTKPMPTEPGTVLGTCHMGGPKGVDLGLAQVENGWASAIPGSGYEPAELSAKHAGRGLWANTAD